MHDSEGSYLHSQQLKSFRYSSPFLSQLRVVVLHVHVTPPLRRGTPTELGLADEGSVVTSRGDIISEALGRRMFVTASTWTKDMVVSNMCVM